MSNSKIKVFFTLLLCFCSIYIALPTIIPKFNSIIPKSWQAKQVNLGLDLRGGASILLEVDIDSYLIDYYKQTLPSITGKFRNSRLQYKDVTHNKDGIDIMFDTVINEKEVIDLIKSVISSNFDYVITGNQLHIKLNNNAFEAIQERLIIQSIEIINRRVDETGTKEIDIQRQGTNYVLLQMPGLDNPDEIKRLLGKTAKLSLHLVAEGVTAENLYKSPLRSKLKLVTSDKNNQYFIVYSNPTILGDMLVDAKVVFDNLGNPAIHFDLNQIGSKIFADFSSKNIGKIMAIILDDKVISSPVIQQPILGGSGTISGKFTVESANELALLLRAGSLPAPLKVIEERIVGPSLGIDSIEAGTTAVIIGITMVIIFMVLFYGTFGMVANIALTINLFMIVALLSLFEATLTLPGIAGIVLTLGMAVDANVLICERIREELSNGTSNWMAIENGYKIAFTTILDANITTVIAALILYYMGTGSVKSFAVTLMIGIACSMFTAISLTKIMTNFWYEITRPKKLCI